MIQEIKGNELYFARLKENAIIPTKESENAGYDVYACLDDDYIEVCQGDIKLISTGICSAFSRYYVAILKERGTTGTKGMAVRSGVVDSSYRGEWFVPINNTSDKIIIIAKNIETTKEAIIKRDSEVFNINAEFIKKTLDKEYIFYPSSKAIAQVILLPLPNMEVNEISAEELQSIPSKRGFGALGSSGK